MDAAPVIYTLRLFRDTDGVAAVLTGPGTLALFGRVAVPAALLGDIAEQAAQVRRLKAAGACRGLPERMPGRRADSAGGRRAAGHPLGYRV
jgi:hypothetical protein